MVVKSALWKLRHPEKAKTASAGTTQTSESAGFKVYVLDSAEQIGAILDEIQSP